MTRNLKTLWLTLVALLALSAVTALSASAEDKFTAPQNIATLTGSTTNNIFKITSPEVKVECTTASFKGTFINGASSATITPEYTGHINATPHTSNSCNATGGTATVNVNGCDYNLTGDTTNSNNGTDAKISISCPAGKEIIITTSLGCTLLIPAQTPTIGGVTYTNGSDGVKKDITVTATSTGITYTTEGFACFIAGIPSEGNNADYTGTVTILGYEDTVPEGPRIDIEVR